MRQITNTNVTFELVFFNTNSLFVVKLLKDIITFTFQQTQVSFMYVFIFTNVENLCSREYVAENCSNILRAFFAKLASIFFNINPIFIYRNIFVL